MKIAKSTQFLAWSLGVLLLSSPLACAQQIINPAQPSESYSIQTVLDELSQANVVYLGETHDNEADHAAQLQIIQALHHHNPQLAIGMEMFQRPFQTALDRYLAGDITEIELRQQSQYDRRWSFPWLYYAPILQFAKENQLPVLALNTPTEVTRRVAEKGLDALTEADYQWVPPLSEIHIDNEAYRRFLRPIYEEFHQEGSSSEDFENFVAAQVLWDETMADGIAEFLVTHPNYQVIVLAGQGHIVYGYGIPSRVARRLQGRNLVQRSLLLNPSADIRTERGIADYLWISFIRSMLKNNPPIFWG